LTSAIARAWSAVTSDVMASMPVIFDAGDEQHHAKREADQDAL
jgi:hypothetical protein